MSWYDSSVSPLVVIRSTSIATNGFGKSQDLIQDSETSTQDGKILEFARIPFDKSGMYTCRAWNQGGEGSSSTVLNVQYIPRIDPDAKMKYVVAGEIGKSASFELYIIANPTPVTTGYVWSKDGNILSMSSQDYEIISGPKSSKLTIKYVKSLDYKNYTCSVKTSGFQAQVFKFKLLKAGPPSAPTKLKVSNSTAVAAMLEWISEFPGGSEQKFYVQFKKSAENWDVASEVPQGGIADPGLKKVVYHKVMDLESNAWYVFRVRSKNSHQGAHISNFSSYASGKTPEAPQTAIMGVSRADNKVTIRWKQVMGKYTVLKIKYCQMGTEDCAYYAVPKPEDNYATFFVDVDKTYYYFMMVEDGGDIVYKSNPLVVDDKTSIDSKIEGGLIGAAIMAMVLVVVVIVAVLLWKFGVLKFCEYRKHQPGGETDAYDDTRLEFTEIANHSSPTYVNQSDTNADQSVQERPGGGQLVQENEPESVYQDIADYGGGFSGRTPASNFQMTSDSECPYDEVNSKNAHGAEADYMNTRRPGTEPTGQSTTERAVGLNGQ